MRDYGYGERGREVNEAHTELRAAATEAVNRNDSKDARTRRWLTALKTFRATYDRVYSSGLRDIDTGKRPTSAVDTADMLDFL